MRLLVVLLFLLLGVLFCCFTVSAVISVSWDSNNYRISAYTTDGDIMTFDDIVDYFKDNPIDTIRMPVQTLDLAENNSDKWDFISYYPGYTSNETTTKTYKNNSVGFTFDGYTLLTQEITGITDTSTQGIFTVFISDTSSFVVGDMVTIDDTDNFDGSYVIQRVYSNRLNLWDTVEPRSLYYSNYGSLHEYAGNLTLYPQLVWNLNFNDLYSGSAWIWTSIANKLKFDIYLGNDRTDAILKDVIVLNRYSSSTDFHSVYGYGTTTKAFNENLKLGSWNSFDIDIREDMLLRRRARGYYHRTHRIYFLFDDIDFEVEHYIDNVRFELENPNPERLPCKSYEFKTPLMFTNGYFEDAGFNFYSTALEHVGFTSVPFYYFQPTTGSSVFGNPDTGEGASFFFDSFCWEDIGSFRIVRSDWYGVSFTLREKMYGGLNFAGSSRYTFNNCYFTNVLNIDVGSNNNYVYNNVKVAGGRYSLWTGASNATFNNVEFIHSNHYPIWLIYPNSATSYGVVELKDVKITSTRAGLLFIRNLAFTSDRYAEIINLDLRDATNVNPAFYIQGAWTGYDINLRISCSFDGVVVDEDANPINATIKLYNKTGHMLWSDVAVDGVIPTKYIPLFEIITSGSTKYYYLNDIENNFDVIHFPLSVSIEADGFESINLTLLKDGYNKNEKFVYQGFDQYFVMINSSNGTGGYKGYIVSHMSTSGFEVVVVLFSLLFCIYVVRRKYK